MSAKYTRLNFIKKRPKFCYSIAIIAFVFLIFLIIIISSFASPSSSSSSSDAPPPTPSPPITYTVMGIGGGGSFYAPMIDPNNDTILYIVSEMGGIYYSYDRGESWNRSYERGIFYTNHISSNSTLLVGGSGLYASFDKGKTLELIHPKNVKYEISRNGWNENIILGDHYHYSYVKAVTSYGDKIYFITCNWSSRFLLMESDFTGNISRVLQNDTETMSDPNSAYIVLLADETGVYYTLRTFINFYNFTDSTMRRIDIPEGEIEDFKKIDDYYLILVDTPSTSKLFYTKDFIEYKDLQDYNKLSNTFIKNETQVTFNWRFYQLSGSSFNNIFLVLNTYINESYEDDNKIYGILKFNGVEFEWVISNTDDSISNMDLSGWSYGRHGQITDVYVSKNNTNLCLVTNFETAYLMEYKNGKIKQINNLHANYEGDSNYSTRGLDVQSTHWVREDPFDSRHIIITTDRLGMQISHDNGKTFTRMNSDSSYIYNTCNDVYFDTHKRDLVYGIWTSRIDAPYFPSSYDKEAYVGGFAVSNDGGINWDFGYSSGLPNTTIPIKMSVKETNSGLLIFALATLNKGFYISYDSGKTFESINEGVEQLEGLEGLILGEDVIIVDDIVYCLTAPMPITSEKWIPSKLYKYSISTNTMESIDLVNITIARSITYDSRYGLLISVIPNSDDHYVDELGTWKYFNYNGGIYVYDGESISKFFDNYDGIFSCGVMSNGDIYAVDTYGKIFKYDGKEWKVFYDGLFTMLKNISFSNNERTIYVTTYGGGTYKFKLKGYFF